MQKRFNMTKTSLHYLPKKTFVWYLFILLITTPIYAQCPDVSYNPAKVISVYDGDTFTAIVDLGYNIQVTEKFRLYGIDTPEIRTSDPQEKQKGLQARDWVRDQILYKDVLISAEKRGKFGRYLATVCYDNKNLQDELIRLGYGEPYFGGKRKDGV